MKKKILKVLIFIILFIALFYLAQSILTKKSENLYSRNHDYASAAPDSIDVLCFGTSEMWADFVPLTAYEETGITSYNFAVTHKAAITMYYQLLQALEYQNPKVVICDFSSLYDDNLPSKSDSFMALYGKVYDNLLDNRLKVAMIKDIMKYDDSLSVFGWVFPLLRYHSMWADLNENNFVSMKELSKGYKKYSKGALLEAKEFKGDVIEITGELWDKESIFDDFAPVSLEFYNKFIDECNSRGIRVVAFMPPSIGAAGSHAKRCEALKAYFESKNVDYFDYNSFYQYERCGLSLADDYYDVEHLNLPGSVKFTKIMAADLQAAYGLTDHRGDAAYYDEWGTYVGDLSEENIKLMMNGETESVLND